MQIWTSKLFLAIPTQYTEPVISSSFIQGYKTVPTIYLCTDNPDY